MVMLMSQNPGCLPEQADPKSARKPPMTPEDSRAMLVPTFKVIARHIPECPHKGEGPTYVGVGCNCKKWVRVYDPRIPDPKKRQTFYLDSKGREQRSPFSAKTRDTAIAESIAQKYRDQFNPDKQRAAAAEAELEKLRTEKEAQIATIEKAVAMFLIFKQNNPSRRSSRRSGPAAKKTIGGYKTLLGYVEPETFTVKREGHLFTWLGQQTPRPILISELTKAKMDAFRATWNWGDLTTSKAFTNLKAFFDYCKGESWIEANPLEGRPQPSVQEGARTAAFTDDQYQSILDTLTQRETDINKATETLRLRAIVELMRWGGLALHDAVNFKFSTLNGDVLRYRRQKTNREAKPILPTHVADLLRGVVPINGDPNQPFRNVEREINSDKDYWRLLLQNLFLDAGIKTVRTDIGERTPHAHMLRDTFAVGQLERNVRDGKPSLKSIADAMGDSVAVLLQHYAPAIDKLTKAHEEEQRKVVADQVAAMNGGRK